jgi:hypothetical protein
MPRRALAVLLVLVAPHAGAAERPEPAIQVAGWLAHSDPATIPLWPLRLQLLMGAVDREGPLVREARQRARAAGNPARFVFYLSLSSLDGGCGCFDADLLARLQRRSPDFVLRDAAGAPVSTFLDALPRGRQLALDVGNPAYVDAWADAALAGAARHGWDGVWADNVVRGSFDGSWSGVPVNPRTRRPYTEAEYRGDMLAAVRRLRARFDRAGKLLIANHSAAWRSFDDDPTLREQVLAVHGVEIEDFAYTFGGSPHPEADWLRQLRYLDFANAHGVLTWAHGGNDTLMRPAAREFVLASYLLTRAGRSVVGDLNAARTWWPALATDLGAPEGGFYCLDPGAGFARADPCPAPGGVLGRDFAHARVLVNPGDTPRRVPLGGARLRTLAGGEAADPLPLAPHAGAVLLRPGHTASRTSSGRAGR